jgi:antitoxin (DNA-binding transcriptional repressor) of toxin-antitoxin stability system
MTEHKHAEVLRAIADGKEVEMKIRDRWVATLINAPFATDVVNPISSPDFEWRIKPQPPIVVEKHTLLDEYGYMTAGNGEPNIRFTFDPDTKLPIKVELI